MLLEQGLEGLRFDVHYARCKYCSELPARGRAGPLAASRGGATPLQDRVLGSLIQDFNKGDPNLTQGQQLLLRIVGDYDEREFQRRQRGTG